MTHHHPHVVAGDPGGPLRADDPPREVPQERGEPIGVDGAALAVGERGDAIYLVGVEVVVVVVIAVIVGKPRRKN